MNSKEGSIYITCEGEKTENYFFQHLYDYLLDKGKCALSHKPEIHPSPLTSDKVQPLVGELRKVRKGRVTNGSNTGHQTPDGYPQPLNWIMDAKEKLNNHSEAWAVFDDDNKPARYEALQEVINCRQSGLNVNLAYSSLSFEFYMLQHFEYCYHKFNKTECKGTQETGLKGKYLECCKNSAKQGSCDGDINHDACINGYARAHGYWMDSKNDQAFETIGNLWRGVNNAYHVKWQSVRDFGTSSLHDQNPFLNTYRLVLRFMGILSLEPDRDFTYSKANGDIVVSHFFGRINVKNNRNSSIIVRFKTFTTIHADSGEKLFHEELETVSQMVMPCSDSYFELSPKVEEYSLLTIEESCIFVSFISELGFSLTSCDIQNLNWAN